MALKVLSERGLSNAATARTLDVTEGAVRYHLKRQREGAVDGRSRQRPLACDYRRQIEGWLEAAGEEGVNLALLHEWLVEEHAYPGSLRNLQRYFRRNFPQPRKRARRRVETPAGAQAQADWAEFRGVLVAGRREDLYAFHLVLSHSRYDVVVFSAGKDQLAWHQVHNEALRRLGGVPAVIRVDNERTAVSRGAGAWGEINPAYRRYSQSVRFHVDACPPRSPAYKGKVERQIREQRLRADPRRTHWTDLKELQRWTDERMQASARRRICPATGLSVWESFRAEQPYLAPLPLLPEPFDLVVTRRVADDCMVRFEGRSYSVPFCLIGRQVEVRGCSGKVQFLHGACLAASHPRGTARRILIEPSHFEGDSTTEVAAPAPLGRMGRRLEELRAMPPQQRPLDLYAALAEAAR